MEVNQQGRWFKKEKTVSLKLDILTKSKAKRNNKGKRVGYQVESGIKHKAKHDDKFMNMTTEDRYALPGPELYIID